MGLKAKNATLSGNLRGTNADRARFQDWLLWGLGVLGARLAKRGGHDLRLKALRSGSRGNLIYGVRNEFLRKSRRGRRLKFRAPEKGKKREEKKLSMNDHMNADSYSLRGGLLQVLGPDEGVQGTRPGGGEGG